MDPDIPDFYVTLMSVVDVNEGEEILLNWDRHPKVREAARKYEKGFTQKFPDQPADLPFFRIKIVPGATLPRHKGVRPQGELMMNNINEGVEKLLKEKCVRECESDARAQVLLVKKPDGTWRFCIDYRNLNDITIPDSYPLPNIEEILQKLKGKALYSVIDLLRGYYQLGLHEDSKPYSFHYSIWSL